MLESLLKDLLSLEVREEYRESRRGELRQINLDDRCDQAYIRNRFRRHLKANMNTLEGVRMIDNYHNAIRYSFTDLETLEGLNKVIKSIDNWINNTDKEGYKALRLELY
ncbi:MAG: hypothetical protein ACRC18_06990 [Cetobacterium sp.]